ncbi:MAG: hypothetical protein RIR33_1997 [Pseudomonadota bacterium]|jgi:hypothetical protein
MRTKRVRQITVIVLLAMAALPGNAVADAEKANACRTKLTPIGQKMFDATSPHVTRSSQLPELLRTHVSSLVLSGKISRSDAEANAQSVGACLRLLRS